MPSLRDKLKRFAYTQRFRAEVAAAGRRSDIPLVKPDFLGIGTARSASTWLHSRLNQHPDVYVPKLKELHFFNEKREHLSCDVSGASWTRPVYFDLENPAHWRWYSLQFLPGQDKVKGEITPDYSTLSLERVGEVKRHLPEAKIILNIRNPIDRAWSGLRYSWQRHWDERLSPADVDRLMRAATHPERLLRGDYRLTLTNWEAHYPEAQRLYLVYDDITTQPSVELRRVADFLGIDAAKLAREGDEKRVNTAPAENIPAEVRVRLQDHYEVSIRWLETHLNRDFSHWLE